MRVAARKTNLAGADTILYSVAKSGAASNFHAVTQGTNGSCGTLCTAMPGYDYVTGLGTPQAVAIISSLVAH